MGIWIRTNTNDTLTFEGTIPTSTDIMLETGWNIVSLPKPTSGNYVLPKEVENIGSFEGSKEYNPVYGYNPGNFIFESGNWYWVYNGVDSVVTWTVDY